MANSSVSITIQMFYNDLDTFQPVVSAELSRLWTRLETALLAHMTDPTPTIDVPAHHRPNSAVVFFRHNGKTERYIITGEGGRLVSRNEPLP